MITLRKNLLALCFIILCTFLAGCTSPPGAAPPASPQAPATGPGLTISAPADGAVLPGGSITVSVQVSNFNLVPSYGQPYVAGEGHLHYYLDLPVIANAVRPPVTPPGSFIATTATSYTFENVPPGVHIFTVELASSDHSPFVHPVNRTVTVTVTGSTAAGGTTPGPDIRSCTTDADCVPEGCCHATSCINLAYKEVCTVACTNVCQGPLDCGAGHCGCVNGHCGIASGP